MKKITAYRLPRMATTDYVSGEVIQTYSDSKALGVFCDTGLYVTVLEDDFNAPCFIHFFIFQTGDEIPEELLQKGIEFIGTAVDGLYVFNVFVEKGYKL